MTRWIWTLMLLLVVLALAAPAAATTTTPTGVTTVSLDPDQDETAPDFAADANRASLCCQVVGTAAVRVRAGAPTANSIGMILAPGSAANDGHGAQWCSPAPTLPVYFWAITSGAGDLQCEVATW